MTLVLIPHKVEDNIYVRELGRAYQRLGCDVVYGSDNLLELNVKADIVHIQWPEEHYRWNGQGNIELRISNFLFAIKQLKEKGAKIVWTVHNIMPHDYIENEQDLAIYQQLINSADLIHHHCSKSVKLLADKYAVPSNIARIIVPHGHYFAYPNSITREQSRSRLGISPEAFVYLHFGNIRGYKGLDTLFKAFQKISVKNKLLLVAGQYSAISSRGMIYDRMLMAWKKRFSNNTKFILHNIPQEDIQLYLNSSDCVVLSHSHGLNSGVAVLGMSYGKIVIGPRIGCIEWVLNEGDNLSYEAGDFTGLCNRLHEAASMDIKAASTTNSNISANWQWANIASEVIGHSLSEKL